MYLMDCYPVYAKWIREQAAGQYKDGVVPQIAPKANTPGKKEKIGGVLTIDGGIGWSDSFEIVPYRLMKRYGDDALVRENYEAMKQKKATPFQTLPSLIPFGKYSLLIYISFTYTFKTTYKESFSSYPYGYRL